VSVIEQRDSAKCLLGIECITSTFFISFYAILTCGYYLYIGGFLAVVVVQRVCRSYDK